jgi:hypothetical protein
VIRLADWQGLAKRTLFDELDPEAIDFARPRPALPPGTPEDLVAASEAQAERRRSSR